MCVQESTTRFPPVSLGGSLCFVGDNGDVARKTTVEMFYSLFLVVVVVEIYIRRALVSVAMDLKKKKKRDCQLAERTFLFRQSGNKELTWKKS